jgi:hypothetical protein
VNLLRAIRDWWVIHRYRNAATAYGEADSFWFMGKCVGFDRMERRWRKTEQAFVAAGFRPLPLDTWVAHGGYGVPLPASFPQRLAPGEVPVLYAIESEVRGE